MNLTEMEAKVREATNNEPWGASSTLMQQIAAGTYNYREREEIVSFIFRRFTEKAANEWRQIYKSLQLLEYLIKNGSERIIDDVRANLSLIQMLKSFHYIDSKGRDQGLNVRNRSKTLISLLNDDALIRSERKKARNNAKKFGGVSSGAFGGAASITPGSNHGYDDDYTNKVYGDGGVYGERYEDPAAQYNSNSNDNFEEYDVETSKSSSKPTTGSSKVHATASSSSKSKPQPQEPPQDLLQDLVTFDESSSSANAKSSAPVQDDDDDFDDFQAAPSQPQKPNISNSLSNLYQQQPQQQSFFQQPQQQSFFQQPQQQQNTMQQPQQQFSNGAPSYNNINTSSSSATTTGPAKSSNNDAFSSLFSSAKSKNKTSSPSVSSSKKEQNAPAATNTTNDDDFFGDFSSNNTSTANGNGANANSSNSNNNANSNGEIDLLSF
ncbi:uncharacterized protein AC631_00339 [Debaryomyces fabryi]|uniref:ENTH domain-containing protein n=1 Tax=Debaryomyces fabryi TaxID=58627 RepID=A0A0V1Q619_9ASCO|nr:uncharacterized protein AC631_00339 [Debaryomyces fabryi]KSA03884.1 hypothetical protein AC631_00339 [Debaryomyces fabryi]